MPTSTERVENQIRRLEGFEVIILHPDGRNVRDERHGLPGYPYERAAPDTMTVDAWRRLRFSQTYPGFKCAVLDGRGVPVAYGQTSLKTVRSSYSS